MATDGKEKNNKVMLLKITSETLQQAKGFKLKHNYEILFCRSGSGVCGWEVLQHNKREVRQ